MDSVNERVTGDDHMRLYKGSAPSGRAQLAQRALRRRRLPASASPAGCSRQQASPGFIELWSLQSRMAYNVRNRGKGTT